MCAFPQAHVLLGVRCCADVPFGSLSAAASSPIGFDSIRAAAGRRRGSGRCVCHAFECVRVVLCVGLLESPSDNLNLRKHKLFQQALTDLSCVVNPSQVSYRMPN